MSAAVDLLVVGAGPAGLAAATLAAELGLDVVVIDEQTAPGGQIYRGLGGAVANAIADVLGPEYAGGAPLFDAFRDSGAEFRAGLAVWRVEPDGTVAWRDGRRAGTLRAQRIILAPGAMERPVPVPGWTLPGVMGAGAAQTLLKSAGMVPDGRIVIAGCGPLHLLVTCQLLAAGADVAAVLDTTRPGNWIGAARFVPKALAAAEHLARGAGMLRTIRRAPVPVHWWARHIEARGDGRLEKVRFIEAGASREIAADILLLHEGVVPNVHLSRQAGCAHEWHAAQRCWRPVLDPWGATTLERVAVAGDAGGILGAEAAALSGRIAALDAAFRLGRIDRAERDRRGAPFRRERERLCALRRLLDRLYRPRPEILVPEDGTIVCRCEEVTAGQIREAVRLGAAGPNQVKALTRCGMGPCQGRMCGLVAAEIVAALRGRTVPETGHFRARPPVRPVTLGELAAMMDDDAH